jgi:hypothetical protein
MIDKSSAISAPFSKAELARFYGSNVLENHYAVWMVNSSEHRDSRGFWGHLELARASDQIQARDVTFWGVLALCAWGVALASTSLSAFLPDGLLGGLHASRLGGGSLSQLRSEVASLEAQAAELRQENAVLLQRVTLGEQQRGDVTRRVGDLELTLPRILETLNAGPGIDRSAITASTGSTVKTFDVDGGSVSYTTSPLESSMSSSGALKEQPMPQRLAADVAPDPGAFGVALGPPIAAGQATEAWQGVTARVGTLLIGLGPILGHVEGGPGRRLIAGPISSEADARELCGRMAKTGIACASVSFTGDPLPAAE